MTPATTKKTKVRLTEEQWKLAEQWIQEMGTIPSKPMEPFIIACEELHKKWHELNVIPVNLMANYKLRMKKKGGSKILRDPDDIKYVLLVYGAERGSYRPFFCCDRMHLTTKVQEVTTQNGGTPPRMKIFSPIQFKVNVEEVHEDGVL